MPPLIKPLLGDTLDFAKVLQQLAEGKVAEAEQSVRTALEAKAQEAKPGPEQEIGVQGGKAGPGRGHVKTPDQISGFSALAYGTSQDYLLSRLARDAPEVLDRVKAGEFRSARAAAIEAGIIRPVPTIRLVDDLAKVAAALRKHLDQEQLHRLVEALLA